MNRRTQKRKAYDTIAQYAMSLHGDQGRSPTHCIQILCGIRGAIAAGRAARSGK